MVQSKPYGISFFKYRTVFQVLPFFTFLRTSTSTPYGLWLTTIRDLYFKYHTVFSIATWKTYIATYRTGLVFEPYGITFTEPNGTWISNTVRYFNSDRENLHRYIPYGTRMRTVRDHFYWTVRSFDLRYRTVFQLRGGKITLLHTVRDSHSNRTGSLSFVHFEQHYT